MCRLALNGKSAGSCAGRQTEEVVGTQPDRFKYLVMTLFPTKANASQLQATIRAMPKLCSRCHVLLLTVQTTNLACSRNANGRELLRQFWCHRSQLKHL